MNEILLKGTLRRILPSHTIGGTKYMKADLIVPREGGKEDLLEIKFKEYSNVYKEGDTVLLSGNVRSYSKKQAGERNKVEIYVFTNFTNPFNEEPVYSNHLTLSGEICKIEPLSYTNSGKSNFHFILRDRIVLDNGTCITNYIPCSVWGKLARNYCGMSVGTYVTIEGELHSRIYKKDLGGGEVEFRTAHEALVTGIQIMED